MKKLLFVGALLVALPGVQAADLPSAGSQLQQIPQSATRERAAPQLHISAPEVAAAPAASGPHFLVKQLRVVNASTFTEQQLLAVTAFRPNSEVGLADLNAYANSISNYYRQAGYFLAQAVVPTQDVVNGVVVISVIEGKYGEIEVRNSSHVADGLTDGLMGGLKTGKAVQIRPLESRLLQLADLPGVVVKSTLVPSRTAGAADLVVDVTAGRRVTGSLDADNSGNHYTGENRVGATVNFNNLAGYGDVVSLRVLTSLERLYYGRASWQTRVARANVGLAYTTLGYELGREFESLEATGTAKIASLYGSYPLLRQRDANLDLSLSMDSKRFEDLIEATTPVTRKEKRAGTATLGLSGDHRDGVGGGGRTAYSLQWTSGDLSIETPDAAALDALTAGTDGHYSKVNAQLQRLQRLGDALSLYGSLQAQFAMNNLDVAEKFSLGGAQAVRAYQEGEVYTDEGYLLSLEARLSLTRLASAIPGELQFVTFVDTARGTVSHDPWTTERNHRSLSGGGVGLMWFSAGDFDLKLYYAHTLGSTDATSVPDGDSRIWFNAAKYF